MPTLLSARSKENIVRHVVVLASVSSVKKYGALGVEVDIIKFTSFGLQRFRLAQKA